MYLIKIMTLIKLYKRISDTFSKKENNLNTKENEIKKTRIELPEINCNYHLDFSLYMMDKMINDIFSDLYKENYCWTSQLDQISSINDRWTV